MLTYHQGCSVTTAEVFLSHLAQTFTAFTVCPVKAGLQITGSYLSQFREKVLNLDDVFQPQFLHNIVFLGCEGTEVEWHASATAILKSWGVQKWTFVNNHELRLPPGPYVSYVMRVWQIWRVYADENLTMVTTFKPKAPLPLITNLRYV